MTDTPAIGPGAVVHGVYNAGVVNGPISVNVGSGGERQATPVVDDFVPVVARLGMAFDVVDYSTREGPARDNLLATVPLIIETVLGAAGLRPTKCLIQGTGDGANIFLPANQSPIVVSPQLIHGWRQAWAAAVPHLGPDLRLRVALAYGDVGRSLESDQLRGSAPIALTRQVNSPELRNIAAPGSDAPIALSINMNLYALTSGDGYDIGAGSETVLTKVSTRDVLHYVLSVDPR